MAVPKYKTSKWKRDSRRGHIKLAIPALSECSNCHELIRPHRVCPECGSYKKVEVIDVEAF